VFVSRATLASKRENLLERFSFYDIGIEGVKGALLIVEKELCNP
jgi:hypothetical protein